jgi:D-glycero-D-manno-heptose 1,7-bisphosphate phosphatase
MIKRAVFLDRDGVINPLVYNTDNGKYEAPHRAEDFSVFTYTAAALRLLKNHGFINIVVSNQPDVAKGKTDMTTLKAIERQLCAYSREQGDLIDEFCYCYHHPDGIVPAYTCECRCRKPGTLFLEQAVEKYGLTAEECFFIGDRDSDIVCGRNMGMKTIRIVHPHAQDRDESPAKPCIYAPNLYEAVKWIIDNTQLKA